MNFYPSEPKELDTDTVKELISHGGCPAKNTKCLYLIWCGDNMCNHINPILSKSGKKYMCESATFLIKYISYLNFKKKRKESSHQ